MSLPPFLDLPGGVSAVGLRTPRGTFAALDAARAAVRPDAGTALLLPGYTGSKEDFIALLAPLAALGYRVVAVDQRGQYETLGSRDTADYSLPAMAEDVLGLVDALGDGPVHLVGHSFGGLVGREAVLARPAAFRSFTLLSTGPGGVCPAQAERIGMLVDALLVTDLETIWTAMRELDAAAGVAQPQDPAVAAFLHRRFVTTHQVGLITMGRTLLETPDRVDELAACDVPLMVARGTEDDVWPPAWQDTMANRLNAVRAIVCGAGHSPAADRPAATALALATFWSPDGIAPAVPAAPATPPGR